MATARRDINELYESKKSKRFLEDSSKFDKVLQVSFGESIDKEIITEHKQNGKLKAKIVKI